MSASVSIIIPTHNKCSRLATTLRSFAFQDVTDFEIVVCDDGSSDGTAQMLSEIRVPYQLRVVSGPRRGAAAARNCAVEAATGRVLIFNDDDMVPAPGFIAAHLRACDAEDILSRGQRWSVPIKVVDGFLTQALTHDLYKAMWRTARMTAAEDWTRNSLTTSPLHHYRFLQTCTSNLAMRSTTFARVGAFHEAFGTGWGAEDTELGYRAQLNGVGIRMNDGAMNLHLEHSTDSGSKFQRGLENFRTFKDLYPGKKDIQALFSYLELAISEGHASELFDEQTFMDGIWPPFTWEIADPRGKVSYPEAEASKTSTSDSHGRSKIS